MYSDDNVTPQLKAVATLHWWWRVVWRQTLYAGLIFGVVVLGLVFLLGMHPGVLGVFGILWLIPVFLLVLLAVTVAIYKRSLHKSFHLAGNTWEFVLVEHQHERGSPELSTEEAIRIFWGVVWRNLVINLLFDLVIRGNIQAEIWFGLLAGYLAMFIFMAYPLGSTYLRIRQLGTAKEAGQPLSEPVSRCFFSS